MENDLPVLIIGAGISGLLLAQQLCRLHIPFKIFERDTSFTARGAGWGLTLHWSLPALRELLPEHLLPRLRDTYVDLGAVERGEDSTFPFFDLTTGERKGGVPQSGENQRIRVSREKLRQLLATDIDIQVDLHPNLDVHLVDDSLSSGASRSEGFQTMRQPYVLSLRMAQNAEAVCSLAATAIAHEFVEKCSELRGPQTSG